MDASEPWQIICAKCGIVFSVPKAWRMARVDDQATIYCPNGHTIRLLGSDPVDPDGGEEETDTDDTADNVIKFMKEKA